MTPAPSVVHVSTWDNRGGSGRSAYRIHDGVRRLGLRSRMLVGSRVTADPDVALINDGWLRQADRVSGGVLRRLSLPDLFYPSSFAALRHPWLREADVVQLYNTHGDYFSHSVLPWLSRRHRVVWRLSDMWAMTGHCSYSYDCERWRTGCGACPNLREYPAVRRDSTALLWRIKRALYRRSDLTIVAPSRWMESLAQASPLLNRFPIHRIPNGVDVETFRPMPRPLARAALDLPAEGPVIVFSAHAARKGRDVTREVGERLRARGHRVTLLVLGATGRDRQPPWSMAVKMLEHVTDEARIATAYAAADVSLLPTSADTFPNTILESLACGTPVVAFDVGGCSEAIRHLENGYLATYRDVEDLTRGVEIVLGDREGTAAMGRKARHLAEQEFDRRLEARRFAELYEDTLRPAGTAPLTVDR